MDKLTIRDVDLNGKKVLMRVDFNVPLDKTTGKVTDDNRIVAALPTIKYALDKNARVILMSHLGRPKDGPDPKYSLKPVVERLSELLGQEVKFSNEFVGPESEKMVGELKNGEVLVLENTRFDKREKKNDPELSAELAKYGDIHVNDAFGTAHRGHASNVGVTQHLLSVAGFLLEKEIEFLGKVIENPEKPYVAILGGAKVSDKIGVIENLINKADKLIIGGAMMFTFWKAMGFETGNSLVEEDKVDLALELINKAKEKGVKLVLPVDTLAAEKIEAGAPAETVTSSQGVPAGFMGLDIGPESISLFKSELKNAKTVIWNGPMGVFEIEDFAKGTEEIAKTLAEMKDAVTVIGGGDSAAAIAKFGLKEQVSHVSTGGGASLEMLEGIELPGVKSLADKKKRPVLIAGNWKMYKTPSQAMSFSRKLLTLVGDHKENVQIAICPTYVCLPGVMDILRETGIKVGAQNMWPKDEGAYTGEISPDMLKELEVEFVILGHSERRAYFGETDDFVNEKVKVALKKGLTPIFCLGEVLEERESGKTFDVLKRQTLEGLKGLSADEMLETVVAYEPVWAIGTGKVATPEQAQEAIAFIRSIISEMFGEATAEKVQILYGGSIKPDNFEGILAKPDIDGGLVGGASLKESFSELVCIAEKFTL